MQRNEKEKEVLGAGKREGSGRKCLVAATVILEKGFLFISLTWLIIPAESTLALQETALRPQPGFSSPKPGSRLPPLPAASPLSYLRAAGNLRGPAPPCRGSRDLGAQSPDRASSQHPFPAPSCCCQCRLSTKQVTLPTPTPTFPVAFQRQKVKPLKGRHAGLAQQRKPPGQGVGSQGPPKLLPFSPTPT